MVESGNERDAGARNEVVSSRCRSDASRVRAYKSWEVARRPSGADASRKDGVYMLAHDTAGIRRNDAVDSKSSLRKKRVLGPERRVILAPSWHDVRHFGSYEASLPNRIGAHGGSGLPGQLTPHLRSRKGPKCVATAFTTVRNRGGGARRATRDARDRFGYGTGSSSRKARGVQHARRRKALALHSSTYCERGHAVFAHAEVAIASTEFESFEAGVR